MKIIKSVDEIKSEIYKFKKQNKTIGLITTMGYLHSGHASLIERGRKENDVVVVSIFVNPTQFGPNEDFEKYPRDHERDIKACSELECDIVFMPDKEEMYNENHLTYVEVLDMTKGLCGKSRPEHFRGVTTVVTKFFNIVEPDRAYFGQKDIQQLFVIKKMVEDLNMNLEIVGCPTIRENDGLAMSSRNSYLSKEERKDALLLNKSLTTAQKLIADGERNVEKIKEKMEKIICSGKNNSIDYIEFVDNNLEAITKIKNETIIAIAVNVSNTRLIDNTIIHI